MQHIIYWAHSYRNEDARINQHFGLLIDQAERLIVNFDPPSDRVNAAKLEQNLRGCDGMIAILTWRSTGASPFILYEIGMCLRARKPLLVFIDDRLPDDILPPRVLQRRFSHRTYFRQVRDHVHALRALKAYMGEPPPPRYQPSSGQRTCGLIGADGLDAGTHQTLFDLVGDRGYRVIELESVDTANPLTFDKAEHLSGLDLVVTCSDTETLSSLYWRGAISSAALPCISFTRSADYPFSGAFPRDFQPRPLDVVPWRPLDEGISDELDLFEQDFLSVGDQSAIERYTMMQVQAGLVGRYESNTRRDFVEVIMGDQYKVTGQGIAGPVHAQNISFTQQWTSVENQLDLSRLAEQLERVRAAADSEATGPAEKFAVGAIAAAEESARQKDGPKVLEYLKAAGEWGLKVAEKVSADVAVAALKHALVL